MGSDRIWTKLVSLIRNLFWMPLVQIPVHSESMNCMESSCELCMSSWSWIPKFVSFVTGIPCNCIICDAISPCLGVSRYGISIVVDNMRVIARKQFCGCLLLSGSHLLGKCCFNCCRCVSSRPSCLVVALPVCTLRSSPLWREQETPIRVTFPLLGSCKCPAQRCEKQAFIGQSRAKVTPEGPPRLPSCNQPSQASCWVEEGSQGSSYFVTGRGPYFAL